MPNKRNLETVQALTLRLESSPAVVAVKFSALRAPVSSSIRDDLHRDGISMKVVRNTLATIAANKADRPEIAGLLDGQTTLILGPDDDIVGVSKTLSRVLEGLDEGTKAEVLGAVQNKRVFDGREFQQLAKVPSQTELMAKLAMLLSSPSANLTRTLGAIITGLVVVLNGIAKDKEKKEV